MIIYNITTKINRDIEEDWLRWQKEDHIKEIMDTNLFQEYSIFRLLEQDDSEGPTYVIQFLTDTVEKYHLYISGHALLLREKAFNKWGNQFIAFRSLLKAVQ